MMTMAEGAKVATSTVEALKTQPLALALVVVNVLFLVGGGWVLHDVASAVRTERAAQLTFVRELMQSCAREEQKP